MATDESAGERVFLYIYDLSRGLARSLSPSLIGRQIDGVWHTSVVCYGYEFYYGQGIFVTDQVGRTQYGTPIEIKDMGLTELPQEVFIEYINSLRDIYTAERYHLLDNNCNTFTNDVCQFLVGKTIPSHISSLPEDFLNTPFGQSLRPMIDGAFTPTPPRAFTPSQIQPPSIPAANSHQNIHFPTTPAEFNSLISSSKMAIAFFTSETCGPCKMIEPLFQSLSTTHTNIRFIQVDTHRAYTIAQQHQISATPTFKAFLNGNIYTEWKGADRAALEFNISGLIEASRPPLPPYLRTQYSQAPILFSRAPPLDKVISKIPTTVIPKPLLDSISNFMSGQKGADVLVPSLSDWAQCQRQMDYAMENAWMVVDLLRAGMADRRISGWFAIDGLATLSDIIHKVLARDESEWQLRVVTVQLVANVFSTPLLTVASLRPFLPELVELLTTSLLSSINSPRLNLVKASSSALFNLSRLCISESLSPEEDEIISIVVAVVETLKTLLQKPDAGESKELQRLLVVVIGGYVLLAKESSAVREILSGVEAGDVIGLVEGAVSQEVVGLISG